MIHITMSFINEIQDRGIFYQCTNLESLRQTMSEKKIAAYVGMDATADSLHVGHLIQIMILRLLQQYGHKPIIIIGGGTTKIGDPTDRNKARPILTEEDIAKNANGIKKALKNLIRFGDGESDAIMIDNSDWLCKLQYVDFLRDIGSHFSVNRMIGFDSVKNRLNSDDGISFLELNYMLLQSYDFLYLYEKYECILQMGGSDQWGNIICGVDLIRRKLSKEAFGLTTRLLTNADGVKMGKTESGTVWLDSDKYNTYDFWQFWRNIDDRDVVRFVNMFTGINNPVNAQTDKECNDMKIMLADYMTNMVHGENALCSVKAKINFDPNADYSSVKPDFIFSKEEITELADLLVAVGGCESRSEAKNLIRGSGIYINGAVVDVLGVYDGIFRLSIGKKKHVFVLIG